VNDRVFSDPWASAWSVTSRW